MKIYFLSILIGFESHMIISLHIHSLWETICDARALQVRLPEFLLHFANNTLFLAGQEYPPPAPPPTSPGLKLLMEDLESLGMKPSRITPLPSRIKTSHGRLRKFRYEATKNTPYLKLLIEDLERLGMKPSRITPLPHPGSELLMEDLEIHH